MRISSRVMVYSLLLIFCVQIAFVHVPKSTMAYTSCDGIEQGDVAVVDYKGTVQSTGKVFDSTENRGPATFTIAPDKLIQGFYEGMLGMKIGERKTITVPPEKGYTDINTAPDKSLVGETLIFDVYVQSIKSGTHACNTSNSSGSSDTFLKVIGWIIGLGAVGFFGITGYYRLQKTVTKSCVHCKTEGRDRLSEGKCGKCGNYYCRQSFSRGCPNCKSNTFVPNK